MTSSQSSKPTKTWGPFPPYIATLFFFIMQIAIHRRQLSGLSLVNYQMPSAPEFQVTGLSAKTHIILWFLDWSKHTSYHGGIGA
jgi:hypothetical protein